MEALRTVRFEQEMKASARASAGVATNAGNHSVGAPNQSGGSIAVFGQIGQAVSAQLAYEAKGGTGYSDDALTHFGYAVHAVEDGTSPEHIGEQPWYGYSDAATDYQHAQREKRDALGQTPRDAEALYQARVQAAAYWQYFNQQLEQQRQKDKNK